MTDIELALRQLSEEATNPQDRLERVRVRRVHRRSRQVYLAVASGLVVLSAGGALAIRVSTGSHSLPSTLAPASTAQAPFRRLRVPRRRNPSSVA